MSAVIRFPSAEKQSRARLQAVLDAVDERAKATKATPEQRSNARIAARAHLTATGHAGMAIEVGKKLLPSVRVQAYRQPTFPRTPDAA